MNISDILSLDNINQNDIYNNKIKPIIIQIEQICEDIDEFDEYITGNNFMLYLSKLDSNSHNSSIDLFSKHYFAEVLKDSLKGNLLLKVEGDNDYIKM